LENDHLSLSVGQNLLKTYPLKFFILSFKVLHCSTFNSLALPLLQYKNDQIAKFSQNNSFSKFSLAFIALT
jgi:hypothetical protein